MFKVSAAALCALLSVWCVRADELAAPRDVHFYSVNLRNAVRWSAGTNDTHNITYSVEYAIYGEVEDKAGLEKAAWRPLQQCDDITETECDLTEQTTDTEDEYYARVRAHGPNISSKWTETPRRFRLTDTILGPPQLNVTVVENKLQVKLSGPFRWRKAGERKQPMSLFFPQIIYNISVYNNSSRRTQHFQQQKKVLQHGPLEYNSQYCVRAEVVSLTLQPTTRPSDWICVSTSDDPFKSQLLLLMLGGFLPTAVCLFLLVALAAFAYYYICGHKTKLPRSVNFYHDVNKEMKLQTFQPEKHLPSINVIIFNNTNLNTGESKRAFLSSFHHSADVPERPALPAADGAYAAQDIHPSPKAHCSILSEDYGLLHHEAGTPVRPCAGGGVKSYMAQTGLAEQAQERYEEEEEEEEEKGDAEMPVSTFYSWERNPGPLQLEFPLLSRFNLKTSDSAETQTTETRPLLPHRPDLTSVVVKQASEETGHDDPLLKMEQLWDLQVQSIAE